MNTQSMTVLAQIKQNPKLAYYFAQKAVRVPGLRAPLAVLARLGVPPAQIDPEYAAPAREAFRTLSRDGLVMLPTLRLDADALASIHAQLRDTPLSSYYASNERFQLSAVPGDQTKLTHALSSVLSCKELVRLANHPLVLSLAGLALGAKPTLAAALAWWTFGEHQCPGREHFDDVYHRDVDDLAFVKLFAYLTDVNERNGAHSFVKGSHRSARLMRRGPIRDEEVARVFPGQAITLTGPAGTVFMENTWGIHRPLLATEGRRLIFSAVYTLRSVLPGQQGPSDLPLPPGIDSYVNRRLYRLG